MNEREEREERDEIDESNLSDEVDSTEEHLYELGDPVSFFLCQEK